MALCVRLCVRQLAILISSMGKMLDLLPAAAAFARAPVSNYRVGAVARGLSGELYFGANLEFAGCPIGFTVHAEQSAIANAWMSGERGVSALAVSSAPCGHCRQFLNELATAADLKILIPGLEARRLHDLLPDAFGPQHLGVSVGLMQHPEQQLSGPGLENPLLAAALAAANRSYAPYSGGYAGVALRLHNGDVYSGAYAENAAFNPSLPAMQAALSQVNLAGHEWSEIDKAVLVQAAGRVAVNQYAKTVLAAVSSTPLEVVYLTAPAPAAAPEPPAA
jgi:cytidine deaminase